MECITASEIVGLKINRTENNPPKNSIFYLKEVEI